MQTVAANKVASRNAVRPASARASRSAVVVRATAEESRRAILAGFVGTVALTASKAALAIGETPVDLIDDRSAKGRGFDIIYEARDLSLNQNMRDGLTQARADLDFTTNRVAESKRRIDADLEPLVQKAYWTLAREDLRTQVGYLRFDLNTLASMKTKDKRKEVLNLKKDFIAKVEALDFALRNKEKDVALVKLTLTRNALDAVLAASL